jgi:hypothetical protein
MRRIEPTIGDTHFSVDPESAKQRRISANAARKRNKTLDLLGTVILCLIVVAVCAAAAVYSGLIPTQSQPGTPQLLERQ